ncbi:uncharacterized protein LODBEIA_P03790 [Lodderomyces beijingensis]|uniref:S-adenosylmethionine-dependent methyltransferase n=1 Tax=Lodderomyces beijingensis TaxID=1775926 RepID=A0ABP0ZG53_9ASCO
MDFDPLSLFTPSPSVEPEIETHYYDQNREPQTQLAENDKQERTNENELDGDDDGHLQPLHILDLPMLRLNPPHEVLTTILKLLSPDQVLNFEPTSNQATETRNFIKEEEIFQSKNITSSELTPALTWLNIHCPRLSTSKSLSQIPQLASPLKLNFSNEFNAYLTRIISNDLSWIPNMHKRDEVHTLSSLRISENCGRMAQPEIIRKIQIPRFNHVIHLKEPSLTNDNLGLKTWGSALMLSARLVRQPHILQGSVLELGSGTGLVGICCGLMGYETTLSDLDAIVPNLECNVRDNGLTGRNARCVELDWSRPESSVIYGEKFETLILSDPIYSRSHPYWVVSVIDLYLGDSGVVLIEIPLRPRFEIERQTLWDLMRDKFVEVECEVEDGFDDFGEAKFCFKKYTRLSMM